MVVSMATTNLFSHPVFKDGAFTSNDRAVRRYAIAKTMRAIDLGAELGAPVYDFWGGREGVEAMAAKPPANALDRYREAIDFLCDYVLDRKYPMRFVIEPKPNEPRGDAFLPTVGHALAFIGMLEHPEMVGVNPETAHETMSGLSFYHAVAQAIWQGKLFHIDLNGQKIGRYDQDLRFGSEGLKDAFFLVKLLEESGYDGPRHFDAHAYRNEDAEGVWDFAAGCMRTYLILREKAKAFAADKEIQAALAEASVAELAEPTVGSYSPAAAAALRAHPGDPDALAIRGYHNERLDQLVMELLMGAR
jgi:xylose isomerase